MHKIKSASEAELRVTSTGDVLTAPEVAELTTKQEQLASELVEVALELRNLEGVALLQLARLFEQVRVARHEGVVRLLQHGHQPGRLRHDALVLVDGTVSGVDEMKDDPDGSPGR